MSRINITITDDGPVEDLVTTLEAIVFVLGSSRYIYPFVNGLKLCNGNSIVDDNAVITLYDVSNVVGFDFANNMKKWLRDGEHLKLRSVSVEGELILEISLNSITGVFSSVDRSKLSDGYVMRGVHVTNYRTNYYIHQ